MSQVTTATTTAAAAVPGRGQALATTWAGSGTSREDWLTGAFLASTRTATTRQAYARDIADWRRWLAERGVGLLYAIRVAVDLHARHAVEVRALSPATVARRLAALSRLYRYAVVADVLKRNPLEHVDRPRVGEQTSRPAWTGASSPTWSRPPGPAATGTKHWCCCPRSTGCA